MSITRENSPAPEEQFSRICRLPSSANKTGHRVLPFPTTLGELERVVAADIARLEGQASTMEKAGIIMQALFDTVFDYSKWEHVNTKYLGDTNSPKDEEIHIPKNTGALRQKDIFHREAGDIVKSGYLVGGGCTDCSTIFIALAEKFGVEVVDVLVTADKYSHEARKSKDHTILRIRDPDDENKVKVLDPKWMMHPSLKKLAEEDPDGFGKEYANWFTEGLAMIPLPDLGEGVVGFRRPSPTGVDRIWVVVGTRDGLPDENYSNLRRKNDIKKFFKNPRAVIRQ